jgi:hypothetical protein
MGELIVHLFYHKGINEPKVAHDGTELPNARDLACSLHSDSYQIEPFITNMFMQWGQLVNHDITSLSIDAGKYTFLNFNLIGFIQ